MTYTVTSHIIVSGAALNSTPLLAHSLISDSKCV